MCLSDVDTRLPVAFAVFVDPVINKIYAVLVVHFVPIQFSGTT